MYKPLIEVIEDKELLDATFEQGLNWKNIPEVLIETVNALEVIVDSLQGYDYEYTFKIIDLYNSLESTITLNVYDDEVGYRFLGINGINLHEPKLTKLNFRSSIIDTYHFDSQKRKIVRYRKSYMVDQLGESELIGAPYDWVEKLYNIQFPKGFYIKI